MYECIIFFNDNYIIICKILICKLLGGVKLDYSEVLHDMKSTIP